MSRTLATLLVTIVFAIGACMAPDAVPASGATSTTGDGSSALVCVQHADCTSGQGCDPASGRCVTLAPEGQAFSVVVSPTAEEGLIPDQFVGVYAGPGGTLDITVSAPVRLKGVVGHAVTEVDGEVDRSALVAGTLIAMAVGKIPGTQFRSEAAVRAAPLSGVGTTFEIAVQAGLEYEFTFVPTDPNLPPHVFSRAFAGSTTLDVALPPVDHYLQIDGVVLADNVSNAPVPGAIITCVGNAPSCTTATTDSEGRFTLTMEPGRASVTLRVAPGKTSIAFPVRLFAYNSEAPLEADGFQVLVVGPIPVSRNVSLQVVGDGPDGMVGIASAQVLVSGLAGGGGVTASGLTDAMGRLSLPLLDGVYAVAVLPGSDSRFASTQVSLELATLEGGAFVIRLEARPRLTGQVIDRESGAPVQNVAVSLMTSRLDVFDNLSDSLPDVSFSTLTDNNGRFESGYDPGRYAVSVTPSSQSGLPRFSQPDLALSGGDKSLTIRMSPASLVKGRISDASGAAVAGAQVQFFFHLPKNAADSEWALQDNSFSNSIQIAGTCRTDATGAYALVLPLIGTATDKGDASYSGEPTGGVTPGTDASPDAGANDQPAEGDETGDINAFGLPEIETN